MSLHSVLYHFSCVSFYIILDSPFYIILDSPFYFSYFWKVTLYFQYLEYM